MASREPEPDDPASSGRRARDEYPLLFKGQTRPSRPGLVARTLKWILAFFRESPGGPGATRSDRAGTIPHPSSVTADPPPRAREATAAHGRLLGEGAKDPPDGRTDEPAAPGEPRTELSSGHPNEEEQEAADEAEEEEEARDEDEVEGGAGEEAEDGENKEYEEEEEGEDEEYEDEQAEDGPPAPTPIHRATLQMLPGRLIPVKDDVGRQEIRFMRPSNPEQEVTIGWERGAPPDHVTIDHPSVQMRHAGMRYRRGQWWIQSLSDDPPVLLNGRPIGPEGGPRHLKDGDLVRFGDLDFRFRMP